MKRFLKSIILAAVLAPLMSHATPIVVTDVSQLDFTGNFEYAVNFHGTGTQTVGDATFTNVDEFGAGLPSGVSLSGFNRDYNWSINLGADSSNNALENVLNTLIWSSGLNPGEIDVAVRQGATYRLQLLFGEGCCSTRNFDVDVETSLLNEQVIGTSTGGSIWTSSRTQGYAMVLDFIATDSILDIDLSRARSGDTNYHISGFTVERIPEPATLLLFSLSLIGLTFAQRRKA